MRIAAAAAVFVVAMFAVSARGEEKIEMINWEGKRDPFTAPLTWIEYVKPPPYQQPPPSEQKARDELANLYIQSENAILEGDSKSALMLADQGLDLVNKLANESIVRLNAERNQLVRARTVADRLYQRELAEKEFAQLNLSLTGVVQSKQARAILNSRVVGRGEVITLPNSVQVVVVTDIQADKVIVRYRGYLMAVELKG